MKATAVAYPIQGLIKYHGLRDAVQRIPYHDSISLCTGPIHTTTTVETIPTGELPSLVIDGRPATGRSAQRCYAVIDHVRKKAGIREPFAMVSRNNFPQFVGLGSSSSGFAALAVAAAKAFGWEASQKELSEAARLGAGSACRSVTGGISEWVTEGDRSYSRQLVPAEELRDWRIVVPLVLHAEPTESVHHQVLSSPFFEARNACMPGALEAMWDALSGGVRSIAPLAELDTLNLHAVAISMGKVAWKPATLEVMQRVWDLRKGGVDAWFSIDTGATAYVNTTRACEKEVADAMQGIHGVSELLHLEPAGPASLTGDHLF